MRPRTAGAAMFVALIMLAAPACTAPSGTASPDETPSGVGTVGTPPPGAVLPADVLLGDRLLTAEGGEIGLADLVTCDECRVTAAWRTPDGWLIRVDQAGKEANRFALWHMPAAGRPTVLVTGDGLPLVTRGTPALPGIRVAWVDDGRLHLARYAGGSVDQIVDTPQPEVEVEPVGDLGLTRPLWPQAIVADAVVLAGTYTGGGLDIWDLWRPDLGDFVPEAYPVIDLLGITYDRQRIIGSYLRYPGTGSKETCLGELSTEDFTPVHSACPSPVEQAVRIDLSPDGRWWMVSYPDRIALYDAEQVWFGVDPARTWPAAMSGGGWRDPGSFVVLTSSGVVTLHADGGGATTVPVALPASAALVVDLRDGT